MSTESPDPEGFDLDSLRRLFQLMEKHGVTEVNLKRGEEKWRIQRGPKRVAAAGNLPQFAPPGPAVGTPLDVFAPPAPATESAPPEDTTITINSPTVGTFYTAPNPEDPPFVTAGTEIEADTIVCIVEAMKVFNQIPAEVRGRIVEMLVNNGDPVEFGQPLFRVEPT